MNQSSQSSKAARPLLPHAAPCAVELKIPDELTMNVWRVEQHAFSSDTGKRGADTDADNGKAFRCDPKGGR